MKDIPFQIDGYHVDRFGVRIRGDSILLAKNGKRYGPLGTGMYNPGDGHVMTVWALDDPRSGIGGTSIRFIDTRDVQVISGNPIIRGLTIFWKAMTDWS